MSVRSVQKPDDRTHNRFSSSRLVQLLQQWQLLEPPTQWPGLAEQLGRWTDWTDAVALAAVLSGDPATAPGAAPSTRSPASPRAALTPAQAWEGLVKVRDGLLADIATDPLFAAAAGVRSSASAQAGDAPDFGACRRQHQAHQRAMERQLAPWREAVRDLLGRHAPVHSPALAPLAALDAVMARALGERESHLLSRLPLALERHFVRLCQGPASNVRSGPASGPGQAQFINDVQALLRAELEFRLEPIEGMLEALNLPGLAAGPHLTRAPAELPS